MRSRTLPKALFDPDYWAARGELGRCVRRPRFGLVRRIDRPPWVLRHYRRGGFIARISQDRYWWSGEDRVRSFAEWRLLARSFATRLERAEAGGGLLPARPVDLSVAT